MGANKVTDTNWIPLSEAFSAAIAEVSTDYWGDITAEGQVFANYESVQILKAAQDFGVEDLDDALALVDARYMEISFRALENGKNSTVGRLLEGCELRVDANGKAFVRSMGYDL